MGKVIHQELWKKLKFDHTNKWYLYKAESVLENEMQEILWDFEIQTGQLIPTRRPDRVTAYKKIRPCLIMDFAVLTDHWVKIKENEKRDKYLDLSRELKKL